MNQKQTRVLLATVGLLLFLIGLWTVPCRAWAAAAVPPLVRPPRLPLQDTSPLSTPMPTATPTSTPTSTPQPTATSAVTSALQIPPSETPALTPTLPPPSPGGLTGWVRENPVMFAGIMVAVLGLIFVGLLVLFFRKRKTRQPKRTGTRPITPLKPATPPTPPAPARLVATDVGGQTQTFMLVAEGFTIGRAADNQLVIGPAFPGGETVSAHHARIFKQGEDWIIADLNSSNGIYINGQRTGRNLLRDGWKVGIGGVVFTFRAGKGA